MSHHKAEYWRAVHNRLCERDTSARDELCCLLPRLIRIVGRKYPHDQDEVTESAEDALLNYVAEPERFDPYRGCALLTWLAIQARGHLSHRLRTKQSRRAHEMVVGTSEAIFENFLSDMGREVAIYRGREKEEFEEERSILDDLLQRLKPFDRGGVVLLRQEGSYEEWAQYLRIEQLSVKEQHRRINAEKDRLKKKMRRWVQRVLKRYLSTPNSMLHGLMVTISWLSLVSTRRSHRPFFVSFKKH